MMRNSILTTIILFFIFSLTISAQKSFFSKSYLEVNMYQFSADNAGFDQGISHKSPNLLRGIEYGYFISQHVSVSIAYTNKDFTFLKNVEPLSLLYQWVENMEEFHIGLEYFIPYKRVGLAISGDFFYRLGDRYSLSRYGFLPGNVEYSSKVNAMGFTPSLQLQYQATSSFSLRIGSAVSFSRERSDVTMIHYGNTSQFLSADNVTEILPLYNLSLRFRLAN